MHLAYSSEEHAWARPRLLKAVKSLGVVKCTAVLSVISLEATCKFFKQVDKFEHRCTFHCLRIH